MALQRKLGKPTDQREALLRNQVSELLWNGKIETTYARAKEVARIAEKLLTVAVNTYTDTVKKVETRKNDKGQDIKVELVNDGPKKLAARRKIMACIGFTNYRECMRKTTFDRSVGRCFFVDKDIQNLLLAKY